MLRVALSGLLLFIVSLVVAQKRDRFTLYDEHSGAPKRIKEGKYIHVDLKTDKCSGWEKRDLTVTGTLLLVEDSTITILQDSEDLNCYSGDSTFTISRFDIPEGTSMTIPNSRIFRISPNSETAASILPGAVYGLSVVAVLFVAPLASVKWFNGWDFNADTYTTISRNGLIVMAVSLPLYLVLNSCSGRTLVPMGHATR